jgi:ubiquitin-protein ligase
MGRRRRAKKSDDDESTTSTTTNRQVALAKLAKDMADLEELPQVTVTTNPSDPLRFSVTLFVVDGYWKGGKFCFEFVIPEDYPYGAPSVTLADPVRMMAKYVFCIC